MVHRFDFSLESGDDLEGKILIYGKFINNSGKDVINDWFGENVRFKSGIDCFMGVYGSFFDVKYKEEDKSVSWNGSGYKFRTVSENKLDYPDADVIYVGEHFLIDVCTECIDAALQMYLVRFYEQKKSKHDLAAKNKGSFESNYSAFAGKSIYDAVMENFVFPVIKARNENNAVLVKYLDKEFGKFYAGSSFKDDAQKLSTLVLNDSPQKSNDELILAYVAKIDAIHLENYEKAGELVKEIQELEQKEG